MDESYEFVMFSSRGPGRSLELGFIISSFNRALKGCESGGVNDAAEVPFQTGKLRSSFPTFSQGDVLNGLTSVRIARATDVQAISSRVADNRCDLVELEKAPP